MASTVEIITSRGLRELEPEKAPDADSLWLAAPRLAELTGWELKPEGFCQGDLCMPIAADVRTALVDGEQVNAVGLWKHLQRPVLADSSGSIFVLGDGSDERARRLDSLQAQDFVLPDLAGKEHRLSSYRGKKVFLTTWSSW